MQFYRISSVFRPLVGISIVSFCSTYSHSQIADPIPESPELSGIILTLEEFVQIPSSSNSAPLARINHLKPMRDGSGRLAINDLNGPLHVVSNQLVSLYLDLDDEIPAFVRSPGLGTGFGSFDFHPDFANNGKFYTSHAESPGSGIADFTGPVGNAPIALQGVVSEWTALDPAAETFFGTRRELLRVDLTHTIHGMQEISFNPNAQVDDPDYGMLYICIGDAGTTIQGYPLNTHRLDSVLGTILRIDTAGNNSPNGQYGVPSDNPWASDGDPDTIDEIWAFGFRNPHRISWDADGDEKMLSGDIGERNIEELNLIVPGGDYGWNVREGTFVINPDFENNPSAGEREDVFELPANDPENGYTYPVAQYDHDQGAAIVSGYVYRGTDAPVLSGLFLFGDIVDGKLYTVEADTLTQGSQAEIKELEVQLDGIKTSMLQLAGDSRADIRFGYDEESELYILEKRKGMVYKVVGAVDENNGGGVREPATGGQLVNISTRGQVGIDDDVLIGGFVVGENSQRVLIQAIGPELTDKGVSGVLADPMLEIFDADENSLGDNDDWEDEAEVAAAVRELWGDGIPFSDGSTSSAVLITLDEGAYTAVISSKDNSTGVALVEVYKID